MMDFIADGPVNAAFDGLQARLRAFFPTSHFGMGIVPARLTPLIWQKLVQRTPWIGLGFAGVQPDAASGRVFKGKAQFTVFVCVKNLNSPLARFRGDAQGPGLIGLIQVATACLQGHELRDVGHVEVTGVSVLAVEGLQDEASEVAGINVTVNFALVGLGAQDFQDFLRLGPTWEFEPPLTEGPADVITVRAP